MTVPCRSPSNWTSMCRGASSRRSRYTSALPKADCASDRAARNAPGERRGVADQPHALSAAAGDCLEHHRVADLVGTSQDVGVGRIGRHRPVVPGTTGTPAAMAAWRAAVLLPISLIASGVGPTKISPASVARGGERGVLRQEPVAGVHGIGPRGSRDRDQLVDAQVGVGRTVAVERPGLVGHAHVPGLAVAV
jgi:hypothetical protein